jgi:hypothetical protein
MGNGVKCRYKKQKNKTECYSTKRNNIPFYFNENG